MLSGAIFGQTEGLLGTDLELRELQRSGRIGRIEVLVDSKSGRTSGTIEIPSSMDKAETAIIAASLETIDRVGPCTATIKVLGVEDVRISKRKSIINRAKEILKNLVGETLPDTQELTDAVRESVRIGEIIEWGPDRMPAGSGILDSDEIIVVEGRADVVNLLRNGIKNCVAIGGTHVPGSLAELSRKKTTTLFVDGDRGGDLIFKEVKQVADIDYIARAPSGKEVEELEKKELHKCLRARVAVEQVGETIQDIPTSTGDDISESDQSDQAPQRGIQQGQGYSQPQQTRTDSQPPAPEQRMVAPPAAPAKPVELDTPHRETFKKFIDEIVGTRAAYLLDSNLQILGRVPISELQRSIEGIEGMDAIVLDGVITSRLLDMLKGKPVKYVVGMRKINVGAVPEGIGLVTPQDLGL
ncbi:MAG: DNA primase DnaG [archaeon]